jgi:RNA polymerase sigma factor (sigma-70 family)
MTTITHDIRAATSDPIARHRYVRPIVREISPVAPASTTPAAPRPAATTRRRPSGAEELERLVMAASAGDRTAVSKLVERFTRRICLVARMHRLAAEDVEDVMQTTWLRLLEHADKIRDPAAVGAWLETTARRESLRLLRTSSRERPTDNELMLDAPVAPVDDERLQATERRVALAAALKQVSGHQRELLSMLFAEPAPSYSEISRRLGMPIGSIGPTRARCLARLRQNQHLGELAESLGDRAAGAARCISRPMSASLAA